MTGRKMEYYIEMAANTRMLYAREVEFRLRHPPDSMPADCSKLLSHYCSERGFRYH